MKTWITAALILGTGTMFGLGSASAEMPRWVALYLFAIAAAAVFLIGLWRRGDLRIGSPDMALFGLFIYVAASLLWSLDWRQGLWQLQNFGALVVVFLWVRHAKPEFIGEMVLASIFIAFAMLAIFPSEIGGYGNPNFATEYLLIALPFLLGIEPGRRWLLVPVAVVGVLVYLVFLNNSRVEILVGAAALVYFYIAHIQRSWLERITIAVVIPVLAVVVGTTNSIHVRMELWFNTLAAWWDAPFFGHGFGSFNYVYDTFRESHLLLLGDQWASVVHNTGKFAGAAHNEVLQGLSEFGLIGMGLVVLFFGLVWENRSEDRGQAWAVLFVATVISFIEFPLQNPHTAVLIAVAFGLICQEDGRLFTIPVLARVPVTAVVLAACLTVGVVGKNAYASSYHMGAVKYFIDKNPVEAFKHNNSAVDVDKLRSYPRRQMMLTLATLITQRRDKVDLGDKAADMVYRLAQTVGPNHPTTLLARLEYLANSGRWKNEIPEVEGIILVLKKYASRQASTWVADAHFASLQGDGNRAARAVAIGLRLPPDGHRPQLNKIGEKLVKELVK